MVKVRFRWGGLGFVKRSEIKSKIEIRVKTLHGERQEHKMQVCISDKVDVIRQRLLKLDSSGELKKYALFKLVHPMAGIQVLRLNRTFEE